MKKSETITISQIQPYSYSPEDILGRGYSSIVYKGVHSLTSQKVAIKAIQKEKDHKKNHIHERMVKSQIEILKDLRNKPHIISLFDIKETSSHTYIITEYCNQGTLKRYMDKKKGLTEEEALHIFRQVLKGYECIYNAGVLHRDIKPANILMKNHQVRIADFGFAIPVRQLLNQPSLVIGSPMYMPYQALKKKVYSFKGDIWALGIMFFQMLSGESLFKAKTQKDLVRQINYGSVKKMLPQRFSSRVQNVLIRMLEFNMNERATFQEVKQIMFCEESIPMRLLSKRNSKTGQRGKTNDNYPATESSQKSISTKQLLDPDQTGFKFKNKNSSRSRRQSTTSIQKPLHKIKSRALTLKIDRAQISQVKPKIESKNKSSEICKQISYQLISQVHFCRFAYKLLMRMIKVSSGTITGTIKCNMKGLIFKKLQEIQELKFIQEGMTGEYKRSKYSKEIQNIVSEYKIRYHQQIQDYQAEWTSFSSFQTNIQAEILRIWNQVKEIEDLAPKSDMIVILDYMITLKQLTKLIERQNLSEFHKNSKIEKIVQGIPSKNITQEHLKAIRNKLRGIKLI